MIGVIPFFLILVYLYIRDGVTNRTLTAHSSWNCRTKGYHMFILYFNVVGLGKISGNCSSLAIIEDVDRSLARYYWW